MSEFSDVISRLAGELHKEVEVIKEIKNPIQEFEKISTLLFDVKLLIDDMKDLQNKLTYQKENIDLPIRSITKLELMPTFEKIAREEVTKAIAQNPEFSHPFFVEQLQKLFSNPDIFQPNERKQIIIHMQDYAGKLRNWSQAIAGFRKDLGFTRGVKEKRRSGKHKRKSAIQRSQYWAKFIAPNIGRGATVWGYTIRGRARHAPGGPPASFWELLDKGNIRVTRLTTNLGHSAFPTPRNSPTKFIDKIEKRATLVYRAKVVAEHGRPTTKQTIHSSIMELQTLIGDATIFIAKIEDRLFPPKREYIEPSEDERVYQPIYRYREDLITNYKLLKVKQEKIETILSDLSEEIVVTDYLRRKQVTIGYTEEGKRIHPRLSTILRRMHALRRGGY